MGYYVVVDLEMCMVPKSCKRRYRHSHETIQIGAALMNEKYEIIDSYSTFVKPEFGFIDDYIESLTGIHKKDVKDAPSIEKALNDFMEWLPKDEEVTAVSWSFSDKYQFLYEINSKKIEVNPRFFDMTDKWIDCQLEFANKMQMKKNYSLEEALIATDIITEGRAHDGLVDAYNTALLYAKIKKEDKLVLNPYYGKAHEDAETECLSYGLGDILSTVGF